MDLQQLKWTKNVRPTGGLYAYSQFKASELFKLTWKDDEDNANRPNRNDSILLRQYGYVTHLVKVLNRQAEMDEGHCDFNIYRIVEVLWTIDCDNPPVFSKADAIFTYPEVLDYQGGNAMKLDELPTFQKQWDIKGGLFAFQKHIQSKIADV